MTSLISFGICFFQHVDCSEKDIILDVYREYHIFTLGPENRGGEDQLRLFSGKKQRDA